MPEIVVERRDSFEDWRVKTNELGTAIGDVDQLTGTNVVEKIQDANDIALAMSIVFGA